ncbi:MAG: DUF2793 domain-containing protein [Pseudomonadota bacterium]
MEHTPNLKLPFIAAAQAQKHVTHNEAIRALDAIVQLAVQGRGLSTPPTQPSDGDRFIVGSAASGSWEGKENQVAAFQDGAWMFYVPVEGWIAWVADENTLVAWDGAGWVVAGGGSTNPAPLVGVNTTADPTNKLSVKSDATLFSHDDVTPGSGDMRQVLNKASASHTVSQLYQSNWSGRAETGLTGDDTFQIKVSADGATWHQALIVEPSTGVVTLPLTPSREVLSTNRTYHVATTGNDANNGLDVGSPFQTITRALGVVYGNLDLNGFDVTIQVAAGTYTENLNVTSPQVGAGRIILSGDTTTPSNVTVAASATGLYVKGAGAKLYIKGIKVTASGFAGWHADGGGSIEALGRNEIGAVGGHQIVADGTGTIYATHPMMVSGGCAGAHLLASNNGFIYTQGASWTFEGTPTVGAFANAGTCGVIYTFANSFSGALTGQRYNASLNGVIQTNTGGNSTALPGTAAGSVASGGQYS